MPLRTPNLLDYLKKLSIISVLLLAFQLLMTSSNYSYAISIDSDDEDEENSESIKRQDTLSGNLDEITIIQNRLSINFSEASRSVTVLDKAQLQSNPGQSLNQMLTYASGVDLRQRGPMGVQADLSIRGGTFEQSLVMLNGIKLSDPQTGHHSLNLPVNLDNVDQVQVLKGPGSRLYGQNAFTGAVNIITRPSEDRRLSINGFGGQHTSFGGTAALNLPVGDEYRQYVSISHDQSDGYRYNTDFDKTNLFMQSELDALGGTFSMMGGYTDREFGANGFYASPQYEDQWETVQTGLASLGYKWSGSSATLKPRIYWRYNDDTYRLVRDNPDFYENNHQTDVYGGELQSSIRSELGKTGIGFEYRQEHINSSNLGNHDRTNLGMYAEHRLTLFERLTVTPGLYLNWYSDYDWNVFPGIDATFNLTSRLKWTANVGNSYRIPTYTDLYYKGPTNIGNPNLKPEEAISYETGLRYVANYLFAQANVYLRDADQLIDWVRDTQDDPWRPENFFNVETRGFEMQTEFLPENIFTSSFLQRIKRITLNYNYIDSELMNETDANSQYALQYLKHQIQAGISYSILQNLQHSIHYKFADRNSEKLENYNVVDTKISWQGGSWSIFAEASNLLSDEYLGPNLIPMPERWVRGGFSYNLNF